MWEIFILAVLVFIVMAFLYSMINKERGSFKYWVKNPQKRDRLAKKMQEKQKGWARLAEKGKQVEKRILSRDENSFIRMLPNVKADDELHACLKKLVILGKSQYFEEFKKIYSKAENKEWYVKEALEKVGENQEIRGPFYRQLYDMVFEDIKAKGYASEAAIDIVWLIDPILTAATFSKREWYQFDRALLSNILESFNKYKYPLKVELIKELFSTAEANLEFDESRNFVSNCAGDMIAELIILMHNMGIPAAEDYAWRFILDPHIDKYASEKIAEMICRKYGIDDIDDYMTRKYEKELHLSFPFSKGDELFRAWVSVGTLDGQVDNGGFAQYFSNGYGYQFVDVLNAAKKMGDDEIYHLLLKVKAEFDKYPPENDYSDEKQARIYARISKKLDEFNSEYYKKSAKVYARLKLYLVSQIKGVSLLEKLSGKTMK